MFDGTGTAAGADGRVGDARVARGRQGPAAAVRRRLRAAVRGRSRSTAVLLVAVLEHTREPWRLLAEARRVLKPGGKVVIVVPNDLTMSAGRLLLAKFPDSLSRSPDDHHAGADARAGCATGSGSSKDSPCRSGRCRSR